MTGMLEALAAVAVGAGSALLPLVNAEAYALVRADDTTCGCLLMVVALATGQTAGKLLLFEAARRGGGRLLPKTKVTSARTSKWATRIKRLLTDKRTAGPAILASALMGVPPLAAVSVAAGATGQSRRFFASVCLIGRTARFGAIALPALYASQALV